MTTETREITSATYTIPACNLSRFEEEIAKLNKRAKRIGCSQITYSTEHAYTESEWIQIGTTNNRRWSTESPGEKWQQTGRVREWLTLTIEGESPRYAGYELVSVLEPLHLEDGTAENIVRDLPGKESPAEYRNRIGECDHCKTRRYRKETFVVRHESGEYKMVGRQCLKDFLGHTDPHKLASLAEILAQLGSICGCAEDEDWGGGFGRVAESWSLEHMLAWTISTMRKDGWMSRTAARDLDSVMATADIVLYLIGPPPNNSKAKREWQKAVDERTPNDKQKQEAKDAIDWVRDLSAAELEKNDYLYNINLIARAGFANVKMAGYACSIVVAYRKALEREIERKKKADRLNEHFGQEGERIQIALRVEFQREISSDFGCTMLHRMVDAQGRCYVWFASSGDIDPGEDVYVTATIKRHAEYNGQLQTQLTRVSEFNTRKIEEQVRAYREKVKLTKPQQKKLERLEEELKIRETALAELAKFEA